jgi:predicted dehydrogenase/threonine dehydrogenase-like Zn-dependent dehydrogenase
MKKIIQSYKTGKIQLVEVPVPSLKKAFVLVRNVSSLLSIGTEKYMLEIGKKSLLGKALARPDLVSDVIAKVKAEGAFKAYKESMARLDNPVPLGYSCAGIVIDVGEDVQEFKNGDRVACTGSGYASHAEVVSVPENLCVKIPQNVDFESASFVALGGIALQAVRIGSPTLGHRVAVIGLGLLGQITVQLLRSAGCHVFGTDISEEKVNMAMDYGAEKGTVSGKKDVTSAARKFAPNGFDSVIIMAATKTNEPLELAAKIAGERAKIVATGLIGLKVPRRTFFEKELDLVVSRAWGPGVFDPLYSEKNIDYPFAYGRWTAKRNLEEFIHQLSAGSVRVNHLVTHRFPIEKALEAYSLILKAKEPHIGVIIEYPGSSDSLSVPGYLLKEKKLSLRTNQRALDDVARPTPCVGFIGAGLFATGTLLPILRSLKSVRLKGVATATGIKGQHVAKKFGFESFTTDYRELLNDDEIDVIFVLTRHGSHAHFITEALKAGKDLYVEKPLCINEGQLKEIVSTYESLITNNQSPRLMVGFNRRFAPTTQQAIRLLSKIPRPLMITVRANVAYIPADSWVHDQEEGGGNIVGEACHFVDLIQALTGSKPVSVHAQSLRSENQGLVAEDNVALTLTMADGSIGTIIYTTGGDKAFERERVEIFGGGAVCVIENFSRLTWSQHGRKKRLGHLFSRVDRGYQAEIEALVNALQKGNSMPVPFEEYVDTTQTTFAAMESLRSGKPVVIH